MSNINATFGRKKKVSHFFSQYFSSTDTVISNLYTHVFNTPNKNELFTLPFYFELENFCKLFFPPFQMRCIYIVVFAILEIGIWCFCLSWLSSIWWFLGKNIYHTHRPKRCNTKKGRRETIFDYSCAS